MAHQGDRTWRVMGLVWLAVVLSACGAAPPRVPTASELEAVPQVTVTVDPKLDAERTRAFEARDGATQLRNAVVTELAGSEKRTGLQGGELHLVVTRFRLRSTAAGVWLGGFAGADMLDVAVTLVRNGETLRTFDTGAGGLTAGIVKPSATGRFNGLVRVVAKRVVETL